MTCENPRRHPNSTPQPAVERSRAPRRGRRGLMLGLLGAGFCAALLGPGTACAQQPYAARPDADAGYARTAPMSPPYSVTLEQSYGGALPTYWEGRSMWVAGREGQAYAIRLHNHSPERVEAVVTVDGRDVLTGREGDYVKQRGYIIEPYGSVVVDGFRQSLDHVAAFRFTGQHDAYSSRMGTPQNVGVIGVAFFEEKVRRARRRPSPVQPRPYYDDHTRPQAEPTPEPWSNAPSRQGTKRSDRASSGAAESEAPASRPYGGSQGADGSYDLDDGYAGYGGRPRRDERLGTQYGETRHSAVREVSFRRKHSRRPDLLVTVYYDSMEGLRARGIAPDPYTPPPPYRPEPEPWPSARFAPPPPNRY